MIGVRFAVAALNPYTNPRPFETATIARTADTGILVDGNLTIRLEGTNTITGDDPDYRYIEGVSVDGDLTVTGDGSLTISNVTSGMVASSLRLESGNLCFRTQGNAFLAN